MNPVYRKEENYQEGSRKLKILVIDSRTCLLDSLAKSIGSTEDVEVSTAGSAGDSVGRYGIGAGSSSANTVLSLGAYSDASRVVNSCTTTFDVVLYCLGGYETESLTEDLELLASEFKQCGVIVVTEREDSLSANLMDSGLIAGIVPAVYNTDQLLCCLWLVKSGIRFVPVDYQQSAAGTDAARIALTEKLEDKLTPRQLEVLEYVSLGKSNKYIAAELSLCESTIKVHVHEVMKRLGATSRTHASYIVNTFYRSDRLPETDSSLLTSPQRSNTALSVS